MEVKLFEIKDRGTFVPVMAIRLGSDIEAERFLFDRAGYGSLPQEQRTYVLLVNLDQTETNHSPDDWITAHHGRTMGIAHAFIIDNWETLIAGQVICVQTIVGERTEPKQSEARR